MRTAFRALKITLILLAIATVFYGLLFLENQRFAPEPEPEVAAALTLPYTFSSGGIIYASQINANFQAIRAVVNALDDANITNNSITGSLKLIDATVSSAKLATDSVTSPKIADGTILGDDISDQAITNTKIATNAVTTGKIADGNVTEAKLDINTAPPATNKVLYYNVAAGKLDYGGVVPTGSTCSQVLVASSTHTAGAGAKKTFAAITGTPTAANTTASTAPVQFRNPLPGTIMSLNVKLDAPIADGVSTIFHFYDNALASDVFSPQCTITTGNSTCTDSVSSFGMGGVESVVLAVETNGGSQARTYTAAVCWSPF